MDGRILFFLLPAFFAAGCDGSVYLGQTGNDSGGREVADSSFVSYPADSTFVDEEIEPETPKKTLYITGVEYPEGYDWQGDLGWDSQGSSLFLIEGSSLVLEVPVGYDSLVSADADMHRCIEGSLYTDFSTDTETVVCRDGVELFRYAGRESIGGMCVGEGDVYTLGTPRSGGDYTFRRNGEALLSGSGTQLLGSLYGDGDSVVFSYSEQGPDGSADSYYVVRDGVPAALDVQTGVSSVLRILMVDSAVYYIASITGETGLFLVFGYRRQMLESSTALSVDIGMWWDGEKCFIAGEYADRTLLWRDTVLEKQVSGGIAGMKVCGKSYICVTLSSAGEPDGICCNGEIMDWPLGYGFVYDSCTAVDGEDFAVGMVNRLNGNCPAVWKNGTVTDLDINGVLTGLDYQ